MLRVDWNIYGKSGGGYVFTAEDALDALTGALYATYSNPGDTALLANILLTLVAPLRMEMITEGVRTVGQGGRWEYRSGGITVTLCPAASAPPTVDL